MYICYFYYFFRLKSLTVVLVHNYYVNIYKLSVKNGKNDIEYFHYNNIYHLRIYENQICGHGYYRSLHFLYFKNLLVKYICYIQCVCQINVFVCLI